MAPNRQLKQLIHQLSQRPGSKVVIISGRSKETLERWFGSMPRLSLVAEHGAWLKDHGEWERRLEQAGDIQPFVRIMKRYTLRTAGAQTTKKQFSAVWHYQRVSPELAYIRSNEIRHELTNAATGSDFIVQTGRKIIEVKPASLNKSVIAKELTDRYPSDFIFAAGDNPSDDDLFASLQSHAHTFRLGSGDTVAKYRLTNSDKLIEILNSF